LFAEIFRAVFSGMFVSLYVGSGKVETALKMLSWKVLLSCIEMHGWVNTGEKFYAFI